MTKYLSPERSQGSRSEDEADDDDAPRGPIAVPFPGSRSKRRGCGFLAYSLGSEDSAAGGPESVRWPKRLRISPRGRPPARPPAPPGQTISAGPVARPSVHPRAESRLAEFCFGFRSSEARCLDCRVGITIEFRTSSRIQRRMIMCSYLMSFETYPKRIVCVEGSAHSCALRRPFLQKLFSMHLLAPS